MQDYQQSDSVGGYHDYYGPGGSAPFLDATGELSGPGTSAYETSDTPSGYVRTSYAYEGYYGNYYQRDTISDGSNYEVQTKYSYYANGNAYLSSTYTGFNLENYGQYSSSPSVDYVYTSESSFEEFSGNSFYYHNEEVQQGFLSTGGYTTEHVSSSGADYNGSYVPGSGEHDLQQSYTDPYGHTTYETS